MKNEFLIVATMIVSCAASLAVADSKKDLNLDAQTQVQLLPGYKPCNGEKPEDRFNDINCQDKEAVESLSIRNNDNGKQMIEDKVQPEGNILKKRFRPFTQ